MLGRTNTGGGVRNGKLYKAGNEYMSITGGWGSGDIGYLWSGSAEWINPATKNADSITIESTAGYAGVVGTKNKINLTDYTKLKVKLTSNANIHGAVVAVVSSREANPQYSSFSPAGQTRYTSGSNIVVPVDLSTIDGSYYVIVTVDGQYTTTVHEVWLEK